MQRVRQLCALWYTRRGAHIARRESIASPTPLVPEACLLSTLSTGERGTLVGLAGGRGSWGKMASLGFTPGVEISIVQNLGRGPLIVALRGIRVAMGRHEARQVQVRRYV